LRLTLAHNTISRRVTVLYIESPFRFISAPCAYIFVTRFSKNSKPRTQNFCNREAEETRKGKDSPRSRRLARAKKQRKEEAKKIYKNLFNFFDLAVKILIWRKA
jgi:hypothetical protein